MVCTFHADDQKDQRSHPLFSRISMPFSILIIVAAEYFGVFYKLYQYSLKHSNPQSELSL